MAELKDIRALIWDLDGTLYRFNDPFKMACNRAAATAACQVDPTLDFDDALKRSIDSEQNHGFSLHWFHHKTRQSYEDLHFAFHDAFDATVIDRNGEMAGSLRRLSLPSVLLTNSSRRWVGRVLNHLDMGGIFGDGNIIALEDVDFQAKSRSAAGFEKAVHILNLPAKEILVVEDMERNLPLAKKLGLQTALVHHGLDGTAADKADFAYDDTVELMRGLLSVQP